VKRAGFRCFSACAGVSARLGRNYRDLAKGGLPTPYPWRKIDLQACPGGARPRFLLPQGRALAAEPSIGRAARVEGAPAPEADLTRALFEQYGSQIFRYCLHQLGSREEAEDAMQSTFLNAFRGIKRGIVPELESAWLFKIAQNVCLSRRRSTWRRDRIESPTDFELVEELTPAPSRRADELMGLQDVLEQMPENQRRAILLREWQGLSYHEIADELELSQAAVETLIFRARRALAQGLEEPPAPRKRRLARGADLGNILAGLKTLLLGGGAAVKVAATVAVVSATTVAATAPVVEHHARPAQARPAAPAASVSVNPATRTSAAPSGAANLAGGVSAPAHHPAPSAAAPATQAAAAAAPDPAASVPPDATVPATEAPATPPPVETPAQAPVAAPAQPAPGADGGTVPTVVPVPTTQPTEVPVITTTLSAPPAAGDPASTSPVVPPALTKEFVVIAPSAAASPVDTTPVARALPPAQAVPPSAPPATGAPASLAVQPPAVTGNDAGPSGSSS